MDRYYIVAEGLRIRNRCSEVVNDDLQNTVQEANDL